MLRLVTVEVVPRKPREDDRHIELVVLLGEGDVGDQVRAFPGVRLIQRGISSYGPWLDDIELCIDARPLWIRHTVPTQGTPTRRRAAHNLDICALMEPL